MECERSAIRVRLLTGLASSANDEPVFGRRGFATRAFARDNWRKVRDAEVQRWSTKDGEQSLSELHDLVAYEVELDSENY